jgi:glutamate formiminotransferase / formiminotetrahydrofolate cyclodeaminase
LYEFSEGFQGRRIGIVFAMSNKIIECVPNFSEGRNKETIEAIAEAIRKTDGCRLLDVDPGESTNRTVYTFTGNPESIVEGALNAARVARERIDMRSHSGGHPRMGAMDVCPFIPVANTTIEECVAVSRRFAQRASEELKIPIYLYEAASEREYRKTLAQIRRGEYEGLAEKIMLPEWKPDYGPIKFIPEWGATATGARFFLIAYNVNVLGTSNQAHRIALNLREAGRGPEQPGKLKHVQGIGWFVDEYNLAQVSVNLTHYQVMPPHVLFEAVKSEAEKLNVGVAGSEIVGLIPLEAMLMAAEYYIQKENLFILEEDQKIRLVVERLGLNSVALFNPKEKIIEYLVSEPPNMPLADSSLRQFIESVGARSSSPGGGAVSAAVAAMGLALGAMAGKLTYGVRKFESVDRDMRESIPPLYKAYKSLIPMIDADSEAYSDFAAALRMPKDNDQEKEKRAKAMQDGLKKAIDVPLSTMGIADAAWDAMTNIARFGNIASASDVEVGARALELGIWGAWRNVVINLKDIKDDTYKKAVLKEADDIAARAKKRCVEILDIISTRVG